MDAAPRTSGVTSSAVARLYVYETSSSSPASMRAATRNAVIESCNVFVVAANRHMPTEVWAHLRPSLSEFLGFVPPELEEEAIKIITAKRIFAHIESQRDEQIAKANESPAPALQRDTAIAEARARFEYVSKGLDVIVSRGEKVCDRFPTLSVELGRAIQKAASEVVPAYMGAPFRFPVLQLTAMELAEVTAVYDLARMQVTGATGMVRDCVRKADAAGRGYIAHLEAAGGMGGVDERNELRQQLVDFRDKRVLRHFGTIPGLPYDGGPVLRYEGRTDQILAAEFVLTTRATKTFDELPRNVNVTTLEGLELIDQTNAAREKIALAQLRPAVQLRDFAAAIKALDDSEKKCVARAGDDGPKLSGKADENRYQFVLQYTGFIELVNK